MAEKAKVEPAFTQWSNAISTYEREFKKWELRATKIGDRYRDEKRQKDTSNQSRINILWSNVQTAIPAVFSRLPKPDVSRRFRDTDPVGRVAALILERALDFEIEHYPDYRQAMKNCVQDRFLGGRGVAWIRKEAIGEDELEQELSPSDYVHWKDFGHTLARTWEEVTGVWRKVYMGREALVARFGEDLGNKIPLDTKPAERKDSGGETEYEAVIYEIWDQKTKTVLFLSKSLGKIIEQKPDPLQLDGFWPCPKPLYATLTNDSLIPVPDYSLYQDQAETLNVLSDRIDGLVHMLQVKGVHDAAESVLARVFTEGENGALLPVKNWMAFAEKQGLKGSIDVLDITPIFNALKVCYEAVEQQKGVIYEITGLSDIIRGQSDPRETAEAVKTKGQFGSMRLRSMQADVAQFATELLQIKAQLICKYQDETLVKISGVQQLPEFAEPPAGVQQGTPQFMQWQAGCQQKIQAALQLLKNSTLRDFRIEIVADSMIYMDEVQEKADRMELAQAVGGFLKEAGPAIAQTPKVAPVLAQLFKFIVTSFKVGKEIEGEIDTFADEMKELAAQPQPPKQDPAVLKVQAESQADQQRMQMEGQQAQQELQAKAQYDQFKAKLDASVAQAQQQAQAQQDAQAQQMEAQREQQKLQMEATARQHEANLAAQQQAAELDFKRFDAELKSRTAIAVAEISAAATLKAAQLSAAKAEAEGGTIKDAKEPASASV